MSKNTKKLPRLLVILGPTGSGKSSLAVALAKKFKGELVSADSRQVYKGLDIGTAKLKPSRGVKQWLVDIVSPDKPFTLKQYQSAALKAIRGINKRGKLPILVGGTALYIKAVVENWDIPRVRPNNSLRRKLERDLKINGLQTLVKQLRKVDPARARRIDVQNSRRVIRALEVAMSSGQSFVGLRKKGKSLFNVLKIGIAVSKSTLRSRLRERVNLMFRRGLVPETTRLLKK